MTDAPNHTSAYTTRIGHICLAWAKLELNVDNEIWLLSGLNSDVVIGACITNQLVSIHSKLKALISLATARELDPKTIAEIKQFNNSIYSTSEKRNRAVHDPWIFMQDDPVPHQWSAARDKTDMNELLRPSPLQHLDDLLGEINKRDQQFVEIRVQLHKHHETQL